MASTTPIYHILSSSSILWRERVVGSNRGLISLQFDTHQDVSGNSQDSGSSAIVDILLQTGKSTISSFHCIPIIILFMQAKVGNLESLLTSKDMKIQELKKPRPRIRMQTAGRGLDGKISLRGSRFNGYCVKRSHEILKYANLEERS